jgi:hypothetical protein
VFYGKMAKREVKLVRQLKVVEFSGSSREERSKPFEDKREKREEDVGQHLLYIVDGSLGHG